MPGDPKECRQRARNCQLLAEASKDALTRQTYIDLAKSWSRLAAELEDAAAFLNTRESLEIRDAPESARPEGDQPRAS